MQVPQGWTDYNGHMNEAHYLEAGSRATDRFMELIGADEDYVAGGRSYFTVESHVRYLAEAHAGDRLTARLRCWGARGANCTSSILSSAATGPVSRQWKRCCSTWTSPRARAAIRATTFLEDWVNSLRCMRA